MGRTDRLLGRLLLLAGAAVVIGSLLPWHIIKGLAIDLNIDGIDSPNNGVVTLVLGVLLAALGWRMVDGKRSPRIVALVLSVGTVVATVWALLDASNAEDDLVSSRDDVLRATFDLDRAYGQWVLLGGSALALVVGLLLARAGRAEQPAEPDDGESLLS